jgi:hypothetical protein
MAYIGSGISRFNTADELTVTGDAVIDTTTLVVDSTNNRVGVLTASPATALDVTGVITTDGMTTSADINFGDNDKAIFGAGSDLQIYHASDNHSNIRETGSGNLQLWGSNTNFLNTAGSKYHATFADGGAVTLYHNGAAKIATTSSGVSVTGATTVTKGSAGTLATFTDGVNSNFVIETASLITTVGNTGGSTALAFKSANTERMRLSSSGSLLAGKTAADSIPTDGIEIDGPNGRVLITRDGNEPLILNRKTSDGIIVDFRKDSTTVGGIYTFSNELALVSGNTGLYFDDANNKIFPLTGSGNVRDNITDLGASNARFKDGYFAGNIRTDSTLFAPSFTCYPNGSAPTADAAIYRPQDGTLGFVSNGSERARFDAAGNLLLGQSSQSVPGLGNTTVGHSIRPNGDIFSSCNAGEALYLNRSTNDGGIVSIRRQGTQVGVISVTTSGTTYNTTSDRRLKSNIQDAASASAKIDAIQVRQFDWNADDSHQDYGLIAQELQPIEPMAVTGDADSDEMMGVDYSKLVPMLIKEIQELRSRVATLEAN